MKTPLIKEHEKNLELIYTKAKKLRKFFRGIDMFFCFNAVSLKSKRIKIEEYNFYSEDNQKKYTKLRIIKSPLFKKIYDLCHDIFFYVTKISYKELEDISFFLIKVLDSNLMEGNKISVFNVDSDLEEHENSRLLKNLVLTLVEDNVLIKKKNFYSFCDLRIYNYFYYTSQTLVPIFFSKGLKCININFLEIFQMLEHLEYEVSNNKVEENEYDANFFLKNDQIFNKLYVYCVGNGKFFFNNSTLTINNSLVSTLYHDQINERNKEIS